MRRIPSLDGLRAISVVFVILYHFLSQPPTIQTPFLLALEKCGSLGVPVFFVLSGFLITRLLLQEHGQTATISLSQFYVRCAFRILPAALLYIATVKILMGSTLAWGHVAAALLFIANMDPTRPWSLIHLWSLGIEEQFYLLWPWALKGWYRHRVKLLLGFFLLTPALRIVEYEFHAPHFLINNLPAMGDQLAIGCLLATFEARLPKIGKPVALLMLATVIGVTWMPGLNFGHRLLNFAIWQPVLDVCLAGLLVHVIQVPYKALNYAPVVWLGKISYSLYLWQQLFTSQTVLHTSRLLVLLVLPCAALSYYFVEQPGLRLRDQRSGDRRTIGAVITT